MSPFREVDRQAGRLAMENVLTPLQKALRKFGAGRPPAQPASTPLSAVTLACEQRERLTGFLIREPDLVATHITSVAVVVRIPGRPGPGATILVTDGRESEAVKRLEDCARISPFVIVGVMFAVAEADRKHPFAYLIERTQEGENAMRLSFERQTSGAVKKQTN